MSIRFAGSRSVHERRRRRLAQESEVSEATETRHPASQGSSENGERPGEDDHFALSPLHSVIRPQIWIHWCVVALCTGCWAGMLYVGDLTEQTDVGLKSILGIRSGRLANFFSTIMLLWAGQLALLIYWYRRKSRNDFHGRYRLWLWVGVTLQFFLAVVATEAHVPFGEYMQRMWPMNVPQYALLSWLVPVSTLGLAIFNLLRLETRSSTCSRVLLWVAGVSAVVAAVSLVVGSVLPPRVCDLVQVGTATLSHLGLATALLFHARYVIHVSNEAPKGNKTPSLLRRIRNFVTTAFGIHVLRLKVPRLRVPRISLARRKSRPIATETQNETDHPPEQVKKRKSERKASKPEVAAATEKPSTSQNQGASNPSNPSNPSAPSGTGQKLRIDQAHTLRGPKGATMSPADELAARIERGEAIDESLLNGLNKKERRRLRKLQNSAERCPASAR